MNYVVVIDGVQHWVKTKKLAHAMGRAARAANKIAFVYSEETYQRFIVGDAN